MKNIFFLLAMISLLCSCNENEEVIEIKTIGVMEFAEGEVQHIVRADEIQWQPCPPNLPEGCEMAMLEGSPKSDDLFTVRFKAIQDMEMPAHTHPKDERATIIEGNAYVAFGEDGTKETAAKFGPGDYYVNARGAVHKVWIDSGTVIQLTGIGPWRADFVK